MIRRRLFGFVLLLLLGLALVSLARASEGENAADDEGGAGEVADAGGAVDAGEGGEEGDGGGATDAGDTGEGGDAGDEGAAGDNGGAGADEGGAGADEGGAGADEGGAGADERGAGNDEGGAGADEGGAGADEGGAGNDEGGAGADDGGAGADEGGAGTDEGGAGADEGGAGADEGGAGNDEGGAGADEGGAGADDGGAGADEGGAGADVGATAGEEGAGADEDTNAEEGGANGDAEEEEALQSKGGIKAGLPAGPKKFSGDDLPISGNCSAEIQEHCKDLTGGAKHFADCITRRMKLEKAQPDNGVPISDGCKHEIRAFKVEMYKDISMDTTMETACKQDIAKFCDDDMLYPEPGSIVACLREVNQVDTVSETCKIEVLRAQQDAANDFKMDPQLDVLCSGEAERLCKNVQPGEGRIQECLRNNRQKLAWDCQAELFRQEVENVDDIRLSVRLFKACLNDKKKFCKNVIPGDARVKDCLENHRLDGDFSPECKAEFDKMMERRATDFRLDSTLRKYCKLDISETCYPDAEDITDVANWDAKVIQCLQDYRDELKDPNCRQQVHQLTKRSAEDIRFDKPLADACHADRQRHCKDVADGMAQVFRCLQDHREELKEVCRSALFDQEVRMAEDIDFKFPMKHACESEKRRFCGNVPQGHGAVIKCLQEKIGEADMGDDCRKEIKRDELRSAEDYRLNYRLNKACFNDVQKMCLRACEKALELGSVTCGGTVLKCLSENKDKIEAEACKKEVFSFEKQVASDIRLDVPLQKACKNDLSQFCSDVSKDHSRTLRCLRKNKDSLSEECKAEERRFSVMEASDIRLTPTLMNACGQELQSFCKDVPPTDGQAFKCLQSKLEELGMGSACKAELNLQQIRHSSDYKLDVRVRKECEADVAQFCDGVDRGQEGHALVLRCMVSKFKMLSASCATEVSYAVRMALWQYSKGANLTKACDATVESKCKSDKAKPIGGVVVGVYGQCLMNQQWKDIEPECKKLVKIVFKEGGHVGGAVDEGKLQETLMKIDALQMSSGSQTEGLVLSGWMALAAVLSFVLVLVATGYAVYKKFVNPGRQYTLVVKGGPV